MALPLSLMVVTLLGMSLACQDGFLSHGPSCYLISKQDASWPEAKVYCQALGADLAVIESAGEQSFLAAHLSMYHASFAHDVFWVDGSDYAEEGVWLWTSKRQRIQLFFWGPGEPNNHDADGELQNCLSLWGGKGFTWDDSTCHTREHFICEMPNTDTPVVGR